MQPALQVFQLSEGYLLAMGDGESYACTNLASLVKALKALLPLDRGKVVPFRTPNAVPVAQNPPTSPTPRVSLPPTTGVVAVQMPGPLPPHEIQALHALADAAYRGQLKERADIDYNLAKYVPSLDRKAWDLFYAEYAADRRGMDDE